MSNEITDISASILQNSRGNETIAVTVATANASGTFAVPEGASTGSKEVKVLKAQEAILVIRERIAPALIGQDATRQFDIDTLLHELDGTAAFESIGGNTALGVSIAAAKAASKAQGRQVWEHIKDLAQLRSQAVAPRLFVNLINGGKHAVGCSPIQEHQIIPDTDDVAVAYDVALCVQKELKVILEEEYGALAVGRGDEGGFTIPTTSVFSPFEHLHEAIIRANAPVKIHIGADIAASSFYNEGTYHIDAEPKNMQGLLAFYNELHVHVPLLSMVEDPFSESDIEGYAAYRAEHPSVVVIGDDLTTTNVRELQSVLDAKAIHGVIIKPNQIGTLSDTLATMRLAFAHNIQCIVSHRSGETEDDFIADLAFATGSFGLKAGAPLSKVRDAKYKRLITIQKTFNA